MSFFWPAALNPDPGVLGRLGRVLHWIGLLIGFPALAGAVAAYNNPGGGPVVTVLFGSVGAVLIMAGRGLRYVLADE